MALVADAVHGIKTGDSEAVTSSRADTPVAYIERKPVGTPFMFGLTSIVGALKDPSGKRIDSLIARRRAEARCDQTVAGGARPILTGACGDEASIM